jgi:hypothetical protein
MVRIKVEGGGSGRLVEMGVRGTEKEAVNKTSICIAIPTLTGICGISRDIC